MKENKKPSYYPILVNLKSFPCLIIGGGNIALQKVNSLLKFNSSITVIAPKICSELIELEKKRNIKVIRKYYSQEDLGQYKIVFSATDIPEVNKQVYNDCKEKGIFLNVVDVPELCDFILPANITRGNLSVSVSSQGKAPFYSKEIKRKLDSIFPNIYEDIFDLAAQFRKTILNSDELNLHENKQKAFKKFNSVDWEKILIEKGKIEAEKYLKKIIKEL